MRTVLTLSVSAVLAVGALSLSAEAAPLYKSVKIPNSPAQTIVALNNATQVLAMRATASGGQEIVIEDWSNGGNNYSESHPTIPAGETVQATDFNESLQIVGYGNANDLTVRRAFFYGDGAFQYLDTTPPIRSSGGARPSSATWSINTHGDAVGDWVDTNVSAAFLFSHGAVSELHGIDPAGVQVHTQKINNLGQIAGEYRNASNLLHTFIYDQGVITDLGSRTTPSDFNDRGEVFGEGFQGSHSLPCFIYSNGTFQYLGALGTAAYVNCSARRMNNAGVAIGYVTGSGGPPNENSSGAFLYSDGKLNRFTDLIDPSDELIRDNLAPEPILINDKNEIIAKTTDASGGNVQYYLLTPVDATDGAFYNFEADTQGWSNAGEDILTVSTSGTQKFAGASSLAIQISTGGFARVAVATPPVPAGRTLTFHIYLPADANMDWIQPFAQEGEAGGWNWHGNWQPLSALQLGAWNTITVQVPDEAQPLNTVGLEINMSQTYSGTVYVDSVSF